MVRSMIMARRSAVLSVNCGGLSLLRSDVAGANIMSVGLGERVTLLIQQVDDKRNESDSRQ